MTDTLRDAVNHAGKIFLIADDTASDYYIARRTESEVKAEFHDMKVGDSRNLSDTKRIIRWR